MLELDDAFLADVGLAELPATEKKSLLKHLDEELELRVGAALSDSLRDEQLREFESIINRDYETIVDWLEANAPEYRSDKIYQRMAASFVRVPEADLVCEYVSTKWLDVNCPDYKAVVARIFAELMVELHSDAPKLLGKLRS
ncbi:DUF5663 domain-containing protein [Mycobacterium sp. ITM-2016-00316]|uniref:DUF5663 domain-containing protein n=1 Tax=Mycobacterium sp. ITM-2016-00316 TaxID=2099695 RepID=UPI000CF846A3|nr:DUF5663 domain-containing protein [Mycobacterium sp. ITM-2016-00316]WNG81136.1 DUF5663 domain-containing protein [Mycobacterium sp. ITM-2016-00316]